MVHVRPARGGGYELVVENSKALRAKARPPEARSPKTGRGGVLPWPRVKPDSRSGPPAEAQRHTGSGAFWDLIDNDDPSTPGSEMSPLLGKAWRWREGEPRVIVLVGPTGAGKTTTIAKLAKHPRVFGGLPVGLLCLDTYRIGAVEQSRIYAELARIPLEVVYETREIDMALRRLRDREVVLVDTPGRGPQRRADAAEIRAQLEVLCPREIHLVLPVGLRPAHLRRLVDNYRPFGITHLLATKVDEYPEDETVFELSSELGLPMRWLANGQEVPMDLKSAVPRTLGAPSVEARERTSLEPA